MKTIGIKLADGTFYPVLEEGTPKKRMLDLTTAKDNQTKVQIDLYRSETGSMDDAEYVDTLEVTKLNPHPNGEPELHLSVGLDENNNLTAEVVDPETGKKSETEVSLVSRTEAERAEPADFAITGSEDATVADDSTEAGTDETLADDSNGIVDADHTSDNANETTFSPDELPDINSSALEDMPFSFDHSEPHVTSEISPAAAGTSSAEGFKGELPDFSDLDNDIPVEDKTLESVDFSKDSLDDIDESNDIIGTESPDLTEDTTADIQTDTTTVADSDNFSTEDFSLPEFGNDDPTVADDSISEDDTTVADDTTLPDFGDDSSDTTFPDFGDDSTDTTLPDFGDDSTDTTLPDFGDDSNDTTLPDFGDDFGSNIDTSTDSTDFDFPEFDVPATDTTPSGLDFDDLDDPSFNSSAVSGGTGAMDFSDLYDKETLAGEHASLYNEDEEEKKTRAPVIICIICAIICVIATVLLLFVVPSKYNLIASRNTNGVSLLDKFFHKEHVIERTVEEPKEEKKYVDVVVEEPKTEAAPEAVEDKIVIAPEPEKVVPKPKPAPVQEKEPETKKTADVKYHIKWGDTLWDISESYYKTPWKYPKIADYNNIKNPDLIISGKDILIPAE